MFKLAEPFFMLVETPLHAGSGNDLGIIDQPIQRERHTGFPKVESSGIKGCIREAFEKLKNQQGKINAPNLLKAFPAVAKQCKKSGNSKSGDSLEFDRALSLVFGPEKGDEHAGAIGFTDARLLLFPVRSVRGVFAWITCPQVLMRMINDFKLAEVENLPKLPGEKSVPKGCQLLLNNVAVVLEEYRFNVVEDETQEGVCSRLADWLSCNVLPFNDEAFEFWRKKMKTDIVVLPDNDFRDFVNLSTEVITRIKIDNKTGTAQDGALFTEEYLPSETVLYSLALASPIFVEKKEDKGILGQGNIAEEKEVLKFWSCGMPDVIQLGGNATIGKGLIRINIPKGGQCEDGR